MRGLLEGKTALSRWGWETEPRGLLPTPIESMGKTTMTGRSAARRPFSDSIWAAGPEPRSAPPRMNGSRRSPGN